jgi:hypothetical protein
LRGEAELVRDGEADALVADVESQSAGVGHRQSVEDRVKNPERV